LEERGIKGRVCYGDEVEEEEERDREKMGRRKKRPNNCHVYWK